MGNCRKPESEMEILEQDAELYGWVWNYLIRNYGERIE